MALGPVSVLLPRKYLRTNLASRSNLWEGTQRDILGRFEPSPKAHKLASRCMKRLSWVTWTVGKDASPVHKSTFHYMELPRLSKR